MSMIDAFLPAKLGSATLSVTAAAQSFRLPVGGSPAAANVPLSSGGEFIEVQNNGAVNVFLETSPGASQAGVETANIVATVAASYPVLPGQSKIIRRQPGDSHISIIGAAAGPTTVFVTVGNGV